MTNKEKFLQLVSEEDTNTLVEVKERVKNREMLRQSQQIALKVLMKLDDLGWSQRDLANAMKVTPQQITKIVSGKENLTIETQIKLQNTLDIPVLASYYENKRTETNEWVVTFEKRDEQIIAQTLDYRTDYHYTKVIKLETSSGSQEYYTALAE